MAENLVEEPRMAVGRHDKDGGGMTALSALWNAQDGAM
ncbi:hypothetical protein ANT2_4576 [plant metagenome]|uniref:Uncharacterized protein n=1 Tax=plant metagenome TaxID=1297885 RepID=A0A484RC41_9ZZZZ